MTARLSFHGAAGNVTGSRFLLAYDGKKYLIDCGLFQGIKSLRLKNWEPFPVSPAEIESVFLTHAHIDHTGYLPRFCKQGFSGSILCTQATAGLSRLMLRDSAHLQEEDARWANKKGFSKHKPAQPLYTAEDAEKALKHFTPHYYGQDIDINDHLRLQFKDAGHILGSAFIDLQLNSGDRPMRLLFSGDIGSPCRPILHDPVQVYDTDYLVIESTYGDRLHSPEHKSAQEELARVINESVERGGILVIPSFAVERAQELLFYIRDLEERGSIPSIPVFLDSPLAIDATKVFEDMKSDYDFEAKLLELEGKLILRPKQLFCTRDVNDSKELHQQREPAIIISASGMLEGGRILHHLEHRLSHAENTVLFVGYQAEGTRGRALLSGAQSIKIHGRQVPVRAVIENISGFSGHADYREILAWLMGFNRPPHTTFIVHGEPAASESLARHIQDMLGWNVVIPKLGQTFSLQPE